LQGSVNAKHVVIFLVVATDITGGGSVGAGF
jgi:hypothetical protein